MFPDPPERGNPRRVRIPSSSRTAYRPSRRTPPALPQLSRHGHGNRPVRGRPEGCVQPTGSRNRCAQAGWMPATSLAPILALVVLALVVVWNRPQDASTPVAVSLSSLRGTNPLSPAPAGKPLQLCIEVPDLLSGREYGVEVVDAAGGPVWKGAVSDISGKLVATMSKPLVRRSVLGPAVRRRLGTTPGIWLIREINQILSSYPAERIPSMIRERTAPTSSAESVRSLAPTVSR